MVALAEACGLGDGLADRGDRALAERDGLLRLRHEVLGGLLGADLLDQLLAAGGEGVVLVLGLAGQLERTLEDDGGDVLDLPSGPPWGSRR